MMIEMMLPFVVVTHTVDVMHPSAVRREHGPVEWQIMVKEVDMTNQVVHMEVLMVEDAVSSVVVMVVEEATTEATMEEDVSSPNEPMALTTGTLGVLVVLQNLVLITGLWMEPYETPSANAFHVTNECSRPWLVMVVEMMLALVAKMLMVRVLYPTAVQRAAEWQITVKDVETTKELVHVEVVMVEDAVSNVVVMLMEVRSMEADVAEVTMPKTLLPLTAGAPVVIAVLLESVLIKSI